ncbi:MAG: M15 family metallopeptidase [Myxococcota bacterium]|nr:M15 family metallopeptidase [Myxococcota bacterium]
MLIFTLPLVHAVEPLYLDKESCSSQFQACQCVEKGCFPTFSSRIDIISPDHKKRLMKGAWEPSCPVPIDELRQVHLLHWTEDGTVKKGELVVAASVAHHVSQVFQKLYEIRFPVHKMQGVENYGGSDRLSMEDNNTSALNCRVVKGTQKWSEHSYGLAIDINPKWNPWVKGKRFDPKNANLYVDRSNYREGMIRSGDPIIQYFSDIGWKWGGNWRSAKDYQHFSRSGR